MAMTFGAMVKSRRQELQMTQQELAKKVGIHRTTIIGYETKGMIPEDIKIRRALCSVLGFTFERLFGENDELEMMRESEKKAERELLMNFAGFNGCVIFLNDVVLEGIERMADFILQADDLAEDSRIAVVGLKRKIECERKDRERETVKSEQNANRHNIKQWGGET